MQTIRTLGPQVCKCLRRTPFGLFGALRLSMNLNRWPMVGEIHADRSEELSSVYFPLLYVSMRLNGLSSLLFG